MNVRTAGNTLATVARPGAQSACQNFGKRPLFPTLGVGLLDFKNSTLLLARNSSPRPELFSSPSLLKRGVRQHLYAPVISYDKATRKLGPGPAEDQVSGHLGERANSEWNKESKCKARSPREPKKPSNTTSAMVQLKRNPRRGPNLATFEKRNLRGAPPSAPGRRTLTADSGENKETAPQTDAPECSRRLPAAVS